MVNQIKPVDLENLQAKRAGEGMADATVDHEIRAAKGVINKAFDNDLVSGDTLRIFKKVKRILKRGSNARKKTITMDQFKTLMDRLPRHARGILAMGFYTGMRRGEILSLTWPQVDMKNRVIKLEAKDTKDREARVIPVCEELYQILDAIPRALHDNHVFLYGGKPLADIRRGLREACEAVGIPYGRFIRGGVVFHDLRHTFTTNMRKAGVPASVRMAMTGHSTAEMDNRYDTVDESDMKVAMSKMGAFLASVDQTVDQKRGE